MYTLVAVVLWLCLIFFFSTRTPSVSHRQSRKLLALFRALGRRLALKDSGVISAAGRIVDRILFYGRAQPPETTLRKAAHFGLYFVLGFLTTKTVFGCCGSGFISLLMGICFPVTVAVADESLQARVGRSSSLDDVVLDGRGAVAGTGVMLVLLWLGSFF